MPPRAAPRWLAKPSASLMLHIVLFVYTAAVWGWHFTPRAGSDSLLLEAGVTAAGAGAGFERKKLPNMLAMASTVQCVRV